MNRNRLNIVRDENEDIIEQKKIDSIILKLFLIMIVIIPIIVSAGIDDFISPIIEIDEVFTSGQKGDVFSLHKSIVAIVFTIMIVVLFIYKILVLNYQIKNNKIYLFLLATVLSILLATAFAPYKMLALFGQPSRYDGGIMYLCYLVLFFIAFEIKYPEKTLKYLSFAFIPFVIINFILSALNFFGVNALSYNTVQKVTTIFLPEGSQLGQGSFLIGTLNQGNYMSGSFGVMAILYLALSFGEQKITNRLIYLLLSTFSTSIILMSLSSSGFITLIFMMAFIIILIVKSNDRFKSIVVMTGFVFMCTGLITFLSNHNPRVWNESVGIFVSNNPFEIKESAYINLKEFVLGPSVKASEKTEFQLPELPKSGVGPGSGRIYIWNQSIKLVMERPLLGYGLDTLPYFFPQNDPEKHAQIETYTVNVDKAHNMYIGILFGTGILGFLCFMGLIFISVFYPIKWLIKAKLNNKINIYLFAFILSWVAFLFQSIFNDTVVGTSMHMWIVAGIVLGYITVNNHEIKEGKVY